MTRLSVLRYRLDRSVHWIVSPLGPRHDLAAIAELRCERNSSSFGRKADRCKQLRPRLHLGASFRDWYE